MALRHQYPAQGIRFGVLVCALLGVGNACAQTAALAAKLAGHPRWKVTATISGFTPFTWRFRVGPDGVLQRNTTDGWQTQAVGSDGSTQIASRDGNTYTIRLDADGRVVLDRNNLRRGATVKIEPEAD